MGDLHAADCKIESIQQVGHNDNEEKCWEEKYRNDSKKWIISDGQYQDDGISTMKLEYQPPVDEVVHRDVGKRRQMLLKHFRHEAEEELIREQNKPPEVEDYCTEYDGKFYMPGFRPDPEYYKKNAELYEKFPLYSSAPLTYYQHYKLNNSDGLMHGLTNTINPSHPFRRNSLFTKPLSEVYDSEQR